jgi:hypothetical protein
MSKDIYTKVLEELGDKFIGNPEDKDTVAQKILTSLIINKAEEYKLLKSKPTKEQLHKDVKALLKVVGDTIIKSREYKDKRYKKSYDKLKDLVDEGKTFGDIFTEIYSDESDLCDIFIRLIEDKEGVVITSAKQLQELSGITEIYGYWDEDKGETVAYKDKTIITKKEAQEEAKTQIEETFIQGMDNRYSTTLEDMLQAGAKYKDILLLNPKDFNLPKQWSGTLAKNKEEVILWAISFIYLIDEPGGFRLMPSLRTIAEDIKAPYSVVMDAYKLVNPHTPYKTLVERTDNYHAIIKDVEQRAAFKLREIVKNETKKFRRDRQLPEPPDNLLQDDKYLLYEDLKILAIKIIGIGLGIKDPKYHDYNPDYVKWLKDNFKEEINDIKNLVDTTPYNRLKNILNGANRY